MRPIDEVRKELAASWVDHPVADLCLAIVNYIESLLPDQAGLITFANLCLATGKKKPDGDLLTAVTILVSSRVEALDARALLVDEDEREHEISPEELAHARSTGELIHPETGYPVKDFEGRLIPFFVPSKKLLGNVSHG